MLKWLVILAQTVRSALKRRQDLALENVAVRQQVAILKHRIPRPRLTNVDRLFWLLISRIWPAWRSVLHVVQPATVVRWRWRSRRLGRPTIDPEIRQLIRRMWRANPLWGAPRIHGELLKLGFEVSEASVSRYMIHHRGPPSQTWRAFLGNHAGEIIALDFFTVPTATFRVLYVLIVLSHDRRRILHFNVTEHPNAQWTARQLLEACDTDSMPRFLLRDNDSIYGAAFQRQATALDIYELTTAPRSPRQNSYAERVIGSIRRECLDHLIVVGRRHLKKILAEYIDYHYTVRTHMSLQKDAPDCRPTQGPELGKILEFTRVCGLHPEYVRMAA